MLLLFRFAFSFGKYFHTIPAKHISVYTWHRECVFSDHSCVHLLRQSCTAFISRQKRAASYEPFQTRKAAVFISAVIAMPLSVKLAAESSTVQHDYQTVSQWLRILRLGQWCSWLVGPLLLFRTHSYTFTFTLQSVNAIWFDLVSDNIIKQTKKQRGVAERCVELKSYFG